jgi:hypothetical protein
MISVPPKTVVLPDENEKENNDRDGSVYVWNMDVAKPEYRPSFLSSSPRTSNVQILNSSDCDRELSDYEKPSIEMKNCEFRSLGPSSISEAKSRPFSPRSNLKDKTVFNYCCKCRKNGKLKSPNRLHSLDEMCPYFRYSRYTTIFDDRNYYSTTDEVAESVATRSTGYNSYNTELTNDSKISMYCESSLLSHDKCRKSHLRTSVCDLDDIIFDRFGDLITENTATDSSQSASSTQDITIDDLRSEALSGRLRATHESDVSPLTTKIMPTSISKSEAEMNSALCQLEMSSDGTDSSLYGDDNGCEDYLFSSFDSPTRLSESINLSKAESEQYTDSDATQIDSEFSEMEPDFVLSHESNSKPLNEPQKCWVDLCDIREFLQGRLRVKIRDFVSYNESLYKHPPGSVREVLSEAVHPHVDCSEHEQRIDQLKNILKEMQRQVNLQS